jgi:hypothetical protein
MMRTAAVTRESLTIAGSDLGWLLSIAQSAGSGFAITAVHTSDPIGDAAYGDGCACAVIELNQRASVVELRELFRRCPHVPFVFVAELPLRHAVAHLIREHGHAVLAGNESPLVIMATVAALLARDRAS